MFRELWTLIDYFLILKLISRLPLHMAQRWARYRGNLLCLARREARAQALNNVSTALPDLKEDRLSAVVWKHFQWISCDEMFTYWLTRESRFLRSFVSISGIEELEAAQEKGRGVIVATGHFGCVSLLFTLLGRLGFCPYLVFQDPEKVTTQPEAWKRYGCMRIDQFERQVGRPVLFTGIGHYERMKTILRRGEALVLGFDIVPSLVRHKVEVEFFDRMSRFPDGIAALYRETGAQVVSSWIEPRNNGSHQIEFEDITGFLEAATNRREVVQLLVRRLERQIRRYPAGWQLWDSSNLFFEDGLTPPAVDRR